MHASERRLGFARAAELGQRPDDRSARLRLAPAVADLLEQLDGLAALAHRFLGTAAPQRDVARSTSIMPTAQRLPGLESFDRDLLGELGGFVEPALHVAHEREQAERPAEPAPVAELAEQFGALLQAALRLCAASPSENEIHARFCSAHASPRRLPSTRYDASASEISASASLCSPRKRCDMPRLRSAFATPETSPTSRHFCTASESVASAAS